MIARREGGKGVGGPGKISIKKKKSSTEQGSTKTVAKNSWRYLFANPDIYKLFFYTDIYL